MTPLAEMAVAHRVPTGDVQTLVLHCGSVVRRLAIVAIITISLGVPVAELFDNWDQTLQAANDTEANAAAIVLCIGVAFAIGTGVVVNRIRALASVSARRSLRSLAAPREIASLLAPAQTVGPPAILRV